MSAEQILRLDRMFTKGRLTFKHLDSTNRMKAPSGHCWLILNAHVAHITGTNSAFYTVREAETVYKFMIQILAADASGGYSLFNTAARDNQAQWQPVFILGDLEMVFTGGVASGITLTILEWPLK